MTDAMMAGILAVLMVIAGIGVMDCQNPTLVVELGTVIDKTIKAEPYKDNTGAWRNHYNNIVKVRTSRGAYEIKVDPDKFWQVEIGDTVEVGLVLGRWSGSLCKEPYLIVPPKGPVMPQGQQ
jgi:hypothetical protein